MSDEFDKIDTPGTDDTSVNEQPGTEAAPEMDSAATESFDDIEAHEDTIRQRSGMPTLDESQSVPAYMGPDLWQGVRDAVTSPGTIGWDKLLDSVRDSAETALESVSGAVMEAGDRDATQAAESAEADRLGGLGAAAAYGIGSGVQEAARTVLDVTHDTDLAMRPLYHRVWKALGIDPGTGRDEESDAYYKQWRGNIPNLAQSLGIQAPDDTFENIIATLAPVALFTAAGGAFMEGAGITSTLSNLRIPGVMGQALSRVGVTGPGVGKTLAEMLNVGVVTGSVLPSDSDNFAGLLKALSGRRDSLGTLSRVWFNAVPGVKDLAHVEGESALEGRVRNGMDAAYGVILGPLAYLAAKNTRIGSLFAKGLASREELAAAAASQAEVEAMLKRLDAFDGGGGRSGIGSDVTGNPLDDIYPQTSGTSDGTQPLVGRAVEQVDSTPMLDASAPSQPHPTEALTSKPTPAPDVTTAEAGDDWTEFLTAPPENRLKKMLAWKEDELSFRIAEAKAQEERAARTLGVDLQTQADNFRTLTQKVGAAVETEGFDKEGYAKHLAQALDSNDPEAFQLALDDWHAFVPGHEDLPTLLTPREVAAWKGSESVTGNVLDVVKRVSTTDAARQKKAVEFLAEALGGKEDPDLRSLSERLLTAQGNAAAGVDSAAHVLLTSRMFLKNNIVPSLDTVMTSLSQSNGAVPELEQVAWRLIEHANAHQEAIRLTKSAAGRLLQSTQIDDELQQALKVVYGEQEYQKYFQPGKAGVEPDGLIRSSVTPTAGRSGPLPTGGTPVPGTAQGANVSATALTPAQRLQVQKVLGMWGGLTPSGKQTVLTSAYRAGQHPVMAAIEGTGKLASDTFSQLLVSSMLFHDSTWFRVLQGTVTAGFYDPISQAVGASLLRTGAEMSAGRAGRLLKGTGGRLFEAVFQGAPIGAEDYRVLQFGARWRLTQLPHSWLTAAKAFWKPSLQGMYSLNENLFKNAGALSEEAIARSLGKDFAGKIFTAGGGAGGAILKTAAFGLGFPSHVLGSIETMINHGALSQRMAEALFQRAIHSGMGDRAADAYVRKHIADLMDDAIVVKSVPKGSVSLRNKTGFDRDQLSNLVEQAGEAADYESLRASGKNEKAFTLGESRLGQTLPFKLANSLSDFVGGIPVIGQPLRAATMPFSRVSANVISRQVQPVQAITAAIGRSALFGRAPGVSKYVDEVLGGLHGPTKQAKLLGHTAMWGALMGLGAASMHYMRENGKDPYYPLGSDAEREAANERGVRYGETFLPDGSTITTQSLQPFVTPVNIGQYSDYILEKYGLADWLRGEARDPSSGLSKSDMDEITRDEMRGHFGHVLEQAAPFAPLFQGIRQTLSGAFSAEGPGDAFKGAEAGLAAGVGNAFERPFRMLDQIPWMGKQVAGRSSSVLDDGPERAFRTGGGGFASGPNPDRVNAYDMSGEILPDKYDPDNTLNQYLESAGFPTVRPYNDKPIDHFLGELESHGIAFHTSQRKQTLIVNGNEHEVNLQHWWNPKTKEHLWDVYNRFLRQQRSTSWVNNGTELKPLKALMNEFAERYLEREKGGPSRVVMIGSKKRILSDSAAALQAYMATMQKGAQADLNNYLLDHAKEFVNKDGTKLPDRIDLEVRLSRPPLTPEEAGAGGEPSTEEVSPADAQGRPGEAGME